MMEMVLILATLAQRYEFKLARDEEVVPWPTFTLRPKTTIMGIVSERKPAHVIASAGVEASKT
jgi:hypothetical protein